MYLHMRTDVLISISYISVAIQFTASQNSSFCSPSKNLLMFVVYQVGTGLKFDDFSFVRIAEETLRYLYIKVSCVVNQQHVALLNVALL